jgi:hypothetical protein
MDEEVVPSDATDRSWQAPQLTVLGKLSSVTQLGTAQVGDFGFMTGPLPGDSGSIS